MGSFHYVARTLQGEKAAGVLEADSQAAVLRMLDERALFPLEVRVAESASRPAGGLRLRRRELGLIYGQLSDLLASGVPLLRALHSLIRAATSRNARALLQDVHDAVADGSSLSDAMRKHPAVFPLLHVAMVQAGERASFLVDVLSSLAVFLERLDELRAKVRGALIYPALLSFLGMTVMVGALIFFVPRFMPLLESVDKPLPTRVLFALSDVLRDWWPLVVVTAVAVPSAVVAAWRSRAGKTLLDRWRFKIPVVGLAFRMVAITRFCRILGTMIQNGVPLIEALTISRDATGSPLLAERVATAIESVRAGEGLTPPLRRGDLFPPQIAAMIGVAEESNQLEKVLLQIADTVERRTHRAVDQAVRLVEPLILCVVAAAIGLLAMGLLMPIFTLAGSLGR